MNAKSDIPKLVFSAKYDHEHAAQYQRKHNESLSRRLSNWREQKVARTALRTAGEPLEVLDLPCGAGRFWSILPETPRRRLIAADNSQGMLDVAAQAYPEALADRVRLLRTSAFAADLDDEAIDCVFCMRLFHHIGQSADRMAILREFRRITRDTVIISMWVSRNFKARRRAQLEQKRKIDFSKTANYQNRFVLRASDVEQEFIDCGFDIVGHHDFLPLYAMWRTYVLRKKR
jgi:ubiquinone/menaquinone biosynthesis C-methylase UbiE